MKKLFMIFFLVFFACAPKKTIKSEQKVVQETVFLESYDKVWNAITEVITKANYTIDSSNTEEGKITTDYIEYSKIGDDWGSVRRINDNRSELEFYSNQIVKHKLDIFLKEEGNNLIRVRIEPYFELAESKFNLKDDLDRFYLRPYTIELKSNGKLEKDLFSEISNALQL